MADPATALGPSNEQRQLALSNAGVTSRLPGLVSGFGPSDPYRRADRQRSKMIAWRTHSTAAAYMKPPGTLPLGQKLDQCAVESLRFFELDPVSGVREYAKFVESGRSPEKVFNGSQL